MNTHEPRPIRQAGYMLLEVLVSVVIFSVGVLGVVAMQAVSLQGGGGAKYRADASMLADELIGRMWAYDRDPAVLQALYQGASGSGGDQYLSWLADVQARLPRAGEFPPTVTVTPVNGAFPPLSSKSVVSVTLNWKAPGEAAADPPHNYVAVAEIK